MEKKMDRRTFLVRMGRGMLIAVALSEMDGLRPRPGGAGETFPTPKKKSRCPVCGMFSIRYPKWNAGMKFKDGTTAFFCSPKCFLHAYHHIGKYFPGKTRKDIVLMWVTDYYTTEKIQADAPDTYFVAGTSLVGPMGWDVVPVKGKKAAEVLKKDYDGTDIVHLDGVTEEMVQRARRGMRK